jgi:hypothetical protein
MLSFKIIIYNKGLNKQMRRGMHIISKTRRIDGIGRR